MMSVDWTQIREVSAPPDTHLEELGVGVEQLLGRWIPVPWVMP